VLKGTFEWSHVPASVEDFVEGWCEVNNSGDRNKFLLFGFGVVCWALWKARNKMAIEKKVVKSPRVLIFQVISNAAMENPAVGARTEAGAGCSQGA
jgi:hypothetical protein